jgi:hypothetical protein
MSETNGFTAKLFKWDDDLAFCSTDDVAQRMDIREGDDFECEVIGPDRFRLLFVRAGR